MLTRQLTSGWTDGLETLHRFNMDSIIVSRKWVYKAGHAPHDWMHVVLDHVEKVWIFAIVRLSDNQGLRKVTTCMDARFAFQANDELLEYLKAHEEEWLDNQPIEIPQSWVNSAEDDTAPVSENFSPTRLTRARAFRNLLSATLQSGRTLSPET